jgi:heterodisulfide reductase subunit A-like polyferredoxin
VLNLRKKVSWVHSLDAPSKTEEIMVKEFGKQDIFEKLNEKRDANTKNE